MKSSSTLRWLRPTLVVIVSYLLVLLGLFLFWPKGEASRDLLQMEQLSSKLDSLIQPSPALNAEDVVRVQLAALGSKEQPRGIVQCMAFASPDNRIVTGPVERFGRMVRSPPFDVLADPDRILVGKSIIVNGQARVLVTLVDGHQLWSFVWVLSKQQKSPWKDCWMTDGVFPVDNGDNDDDGGAGGSNTVI